MSRPLHLVVLSGNTSRPSKSRALGKAIADRLGADLPLRVRDLDLAEAGPGLGAAFDRDGLDPAAAAVVAAVEAAEALVVSTPVYRGSYPGLFKHLFDLVAPETLAAKPVLLAATGGGHRHALVVEHQLRPLFAFFSAAVGPTAVYAAESDFHDGVPADRQLHARIDLAVRHFRPLLAPPEEQWRRAAVG